MALTEESLLLDNGRAGFRTTSSYFSAADRVLVAGVLISAALSFTQVPILYAIRIMECEEFFKQHQPFMGQDDNRCSRKEIDASTAAQVSLLGLTTIFFGVLNLFVAGWQVKKWGPRTALILQTSFPVLRTGIQVIAVTIGARQGVMTIQSSQIVGLLAGSAGHLLCLNTAAGEVVRPAERTGMFGKLQGAVMLGTAAGYLLGGITGDAFGIRRPFEVSTILFVVSVAYSALFIPFIDPKSLSGGKSQSTGGLKSVLAPFRVLMPQRIRLENGKLVQHFGITFLALGVFLGVLATGYAPLLIQMYATAAFGFRSTDNGYLMASNALIRGLFLIFLFPKIISMGRRWYSKSMSSSNLPPDGPVIPTAPEEFDPIPGIMPAQEPATPMQSAEDKSGKAFDLFFLRWSLVADGLITAYTAFASSSWQIYMGNRAIAPASLRVGSSQQRRDHRNVLAVGTRRCTASHDACGKCSNAFHAWGEAYLTFYCNAAVALVAVLVLFLSNFPPERSQMVKDVSDNAVGDVNEETQGLLSS
ncbi:hypothetical protein PFICI_00093 [Pestalotiopsis fici W106-1]|uniref:Major facilitator superfamily (MFS) profile domain-containing protein n=1 Tax=Pestalotiopsis fici (strain W106-1 / CGMCC3.15140) TaxID=1229662 RepID=W3XJU3_PESFW|nr:uncharacterized protein PFICI_00093 [Pestalotiopsis fici W106-1]ETS86265.1 hypothetical protein PFICI_00093 [Pestalotiopsis fici W106-1]